MDMLFICLLCILLAPFTAIVQGDVLRWFGIA